MNNFIFQNSTKLIFGKNTEDSVGSEIKNYSNKILLHYGGGSIIKTGLYNKITKSLKDSGVEFI